MSHLLSTRLTHLLGAEYPVIQTAMGWVADARLVAATARGGGFGFLAGAVMTPQQVEAGIHAIRSHTDRPFGVNFHMYTPTARDIAEICIRERVKAVSYSRAPSKDMVKRFKEAGIVCIPTVGAVKHAVKAVELGADAVVVQGGEGGGHTGSVASNILLPQVIDALKGSHVPVVAAGGFKDGRGLVAALAYGADGIAMGTRFLMTSDSPVPATTKNAYVSAMPEDIIISRKLDGMPQRMINNACLKHLEQTSPAGLLWLAILNGLRFTRESGHSLLAMLISAWQMKKANGMTLAETLMAGNAPAMIQEAIVHGRVDTGILPSGQVAGVIRDLPGADEVVRAIAREAEELLEQLAGRVNAERQRRETIVPA